MDKRLSSTRLTKRPTSPQCIISVPPPSSPAPSEPIEYLSSAKEKRERSKSQITENTIHTKSGYLCKIQPGKKKKVKKRKFYVGTIAQSKLQIFNYPTEEACFQASRPKKTFSFPDAPRVMIIDRMFFSGEKYENTFSIVSTESTIHLAASSNQEREEWITFFSACLFKVKICRDILLPDEYILQQVHHCTFSATGKQLYLYPTNKPKVEQQQQSKMQMMGTGIVAAGLKKTIQNTTTSSNDNNNNNNNMDNHDEENQQLPQPTSPKNDSFLRTSRTRVKTQIGDEEIIQKLTNCSVELNLKLESKKPEKKSRIIIAKFLWITNFRLLIYYSSDSDLQKKNSSEPSQTNSKKIPIPALKSPFKSLTSHEVQKEKQKEENENLTHDHDHDHKTTLFSHMSIPLDSFYKISLQSEHTIRSHSPTGNHARQDNPNNDRNSSKLRPPSLHSSAIARQVLTINCRDFRTIQFGFDYQKYPEHVTSVKYLMELLTHKIAFRCHSSSFMVKPELFYVRSSTPTTPNEDIPSPTVNDPFKPSPSNSFIDKFYFNYENELKRQNISFEIWKESFELSLSPFYDNTSFISSKRLLFHKSLIVPSNIDDTMIHNASLLRSGGLFPNLVWKNPKNGGSYIFSCLRRNKNNQFSSVGMKRKTPGDKIGNVLNATQNAMIQSGNQIRSSVTGLQQNILNSPGGGGGGSSGNNPMTSSSSSTFVSNQSNVTTNQNDLQNSTINVDINGDNNNNNNNNQIVNADKMLISSICSICSPSQLQLINLINKDLSDNNPMLFVDEIKYLEDIHCSLNNIILPTQKEIFNAYQSLYDFICTKSSSSLSYTQHNQTSSQRSPCYFMKNIENTKWMQLNNQFLTTAFDILQVIENNQSILIQAECSEYYSLLIIQSLIQLLSDPYYRTLSGFCVLLQKEWFSNITYHPKSLSSNIRSLQKKIQFDIASNIPFIQFIDIVWQIIELFPRSFEFNQKYLFFLTDNMNCGTLYFRLSLLFGSNYQMGHNMYNNSFLSSSAIRSRDPKNPNALHPLFFSDDEDEDSSVAVTTFWDYVATYRHEFSNSLFVRNNKLRHSILSTSSAFHLNCWFPYYYRYLNWQK